MMVSIFKVYTVGLVVLGVAIAANAIVAQLKILSWYDFLNQIASDSLQLRIVDALWLFALYPLVLGASAKLGLWVVAKL